MMQKLYSDCTRLKNHVADSISIKMSQEVEELGTSKEDPKLSGKLLESVKPKETKFPPPLPEDKKHLLFG